MEFALYIIVGIIIGILMTVLVLFKISGQGEYKLIRMVDDESGSTYSLKISLLNNEKLKDRKMILLLKR